MFGGSRKVTKGRIIVKLESLIKFWTDFVKVVKFWVSSVFAFSFISFQYANKQKILENTEVPESYF